MDSPASPSAGSLPADVLAAIAKQRGKNKAPTMTAGEIAKHRSGNGCARGGKKRRRTKSAPLSHPFLRAWPMT